MVALAPDHEIVGRGDELAVIDGFLSGIGDGFKALVMRGPAGIGKTVLWRCAVNRAAARGHRVLVAAPTGSETEFSFACLADLLGGPVTEALDVLLQPQRRAVRAALLLEDGEASPRAIAVGWPAPCRRTRSVNRWRPRSRSRGPFVT